MADMNVEVHARSAFLQGALLMEPFERPAFFGKWSSLFELYDQWLHTHNRSALEACLGFTYYSGVDHVIVGVESTDQLNAIVEAIPEGPVNVPNELVSSDLNLINPGNWNL